MLVLTLTALRNVLVFAASFAGIMVASCNFASAQIVALGSSTVDDQRVASNEMWPAVLEEMLRVKASSAHVTNSGVWGETTDRTLARVSSIPSGTKIVILMVNGFNDANKRPQGAANAVANIAAIKSQLAARGIKVIDAMGIYVSVLRQPGMATPDHHHLTVEGNKKLASILAGMVR